MRAVIGSVVSIINSASAGDRAGDSVYRFSVELDLNRVFQIVL